MMWSLCHLVCRSMNNILLLLEIVYIFWSQGKLGMMFFVESVFCIALGLGKSS